MEKMKRVIVVVCLFLLLGAGVALAEPAGLSKQIDAVKFARATGVELAANGKVAVQAGQPIMAKVANQAVLAKLGIKDTKSGEPVEVTYVGKKDWKFVHVPSGQAIIKKGGTDFPANFLK
jgi:hypothetical protein